MSFGLRVALLTMSLMPLAEAVAEDASRLDTLARSLDAPGGLVVHVGAGDARRAAARGGSGRFLVHLLYADGPGAERARSGVAALGLSGRATVSVSGGVNLPFIENVVNLLIVEDGPALSPREMLRVVAPRGKVLTLRGGRWERTTKEVPATIDDWTHNLYDAGNGGVSRDMEAGPPRHLQWTGGPQWSRSHDGNSSFLAMVSAGGRVFYMMDEGLHDGRGLDRVPVPPVQVDPDGAGRVQRQGTLAEAASSTSAHARRPDQERIRQLEPPNGRPG
ncbi:MAG: hypothetical protein ACYTFI_21910 [Planctomycetota bacterium]|jgi:hypothetical protein